MDYNYEPVYDNCLDLLNADLIDLPELNSDVLDEIDKPTNFLESSNDFCNDLFNNLECNNLSLIDNNEQSKIVSVDQSNDISNININKILNYLNSPEQTDNFSSLQITPPDTPPSFESSQNNSSNNQTFSKNNVILEQNIQNDNFSEPLLKRKYAPLAPKLPKEHQFFIQINEQKIINSTVTDKSSNQNLMQNSNCVSLSLNQKNSSLDKNELSKLKKEARRLRNRQAALSSRERKKEYVQNLENELNHLREENQSLKKENQSLRNLVSKITNNSFTQNLKYNNESSNKLVKLVHFTDSYKGKKTISLLAVIFLIGFNFNSFTNDNGVSYSRNLRNKHLSNNNLNQQFKSRILLWADNDLDLNETLYLNKSLSKDYNFIPKDVVNVSEQIILESKLKEWANYYLNRKQQMYYLKNGFNTNVNKKLDYLTSITNDRKLSMNYLRNWVYNAAGFNLYETEQLKKQNLIQNENLNFENIVRAIQPKEDTYYFITLNMADHIILPLKYYSNISTNNSFTAYKQASKPKFSIVMPYTLNNVSNLKNQSRAKKVYSMMEIDCEVSNIKFVKLYKETNIKRNLAIKNLPLPKLINKANSNSTLFNRTRKMGILDKIHSTNKTLTKKKFR